MSEEEIVDSIREALERQLLADVRKLVEAVDEYGDTPSGAGFWFPVEDWLPVEDACAVVKLALARVEGRLK